MSCDSNSKKVGKAAGLKAGLSTIGGKFSHALGTIADQTSGIGYRLGRMTVGISDGVLGVIDRRSIPAQIVREKAVKAAVAGAALKSFGEQGIPADTVEKIPAAAFGTLGSSKILPLALTVTATRQVSTALASLAAQAVREGRTSEKPIIQDRPVEMLGIPLGTAKEQVSVWATKLTPMLNAMDLPSPFQRECCTFSGGAMFQTGGMTWHRGTMIVETPRGQRIICHLQSMTLPSNHYYFSGDITDEEAVGIAAGRIHPERLNCYVGQVSSIESLAPGWASAKHAMIKNVLYCGDPTPAPPMQPEVENRKEYEAYGVES